VSDSAALRVAIDIETLLAFLLSIATRSAAVVETGLKRKKTIYYGFQDITFVKKLQCRKRPQKLLKVSFAK